MAFRVWNDLNTIFNVNFIEMIQDSDHGSFAAFCKFASSYHECHEYIVSIPIRSDRQISKNNFCGLIADAAMNVQNMLEHGTIADITM